MSMKLQASINRLSGAQSNVQNALSFFEVQDGVDTVGKIIDRMSELKGLNQDPMKSSQDQASYNNEFKDLHPTLRHLQMKFNGVSLLQHSNVDCGDSTVFGGSSRVPLDNTLTIYTESDGRLQGHAQVSSSVRSDHTYKHQRFAAFNSASNFNCTLMKPLSLMPP